MMNSGYKGFNLLNLVVCLTSHSDNSFYYKKDDFDEEMKNASRI